MNRETRLAALRDGQSVLNERARMLEEVMRLALAIGDGMLVKAAQNATADCERDISTTEFVIAQLMESTQV